MVFDSPELAGVVHVALRALHDEVFRRQQQDELPSVTSYNPTAAAPTAGTPTPAETGTGNNSGGSSGSSPLLFFVALGFGVVFTNLWIIVGVKYCFRYNARNRNLRMTGEDGEPINLENMPAHPRRRRREKKLMSIDEVNEKFPMMKYKSWVVSRAHEGLPTHGGISQPPSRAGSMILAEGIMPLSKERDSVDETRPTGDASLNRTATVATQEELASDHAEKAGLADAERGRRSTADETSAAGAAAATRTESPTSASDSDADEEVVRIHDALPPDALESSGDTCAICIDTLEDDDDVRGLTCGHAFHAVCLDPWLTSRRACCPLCKADYYTPKPKPAAPEGAAGPEMGPPVSIPPDSRPRMNMPSRPSMTWVFGRRGRASLPLFSRNGNNDSAPAVASPRRSHTIGTVSRTVTARAERTRTENNEAAASETQTGGVFSRIRMPSFRVPGRAPSAGNNNNVSPSNLEAGTRAEEAR